MSMPPALPDQNGPVIVFDGMCVLCSANAHFVLSNDKVQRFRLAAMQGDYGAGLFQHFGVDPDDPDTIIVVDGEKVWRDSDAVLEIYKGLGWPWRVMGVFQLVPRFIRDPIYRLLASNRYRIFGKRDACWLPKPEYKARIL